jgi:cytochrome c556
MDKHEESPPMRTAIILAIALLPPGAAAHSAEDDIEAAINARHGYFTLLGANVGPLAAMAKGETEYDAETAAFHARNLSQLAGYDPSFHFPEGSSKAERPGKTRALAAIWENLEDFQSKHRDFSEAVAALQGAAGAGRAELGAAVGDLGQTCKASHDDYRAEDF